MNTAVYGVAPAGQYLVQVGDGTTNAFTTTLTFATTGVSYSKTEFPQLTNASLTVPSASSALSLTCTFATPTPTADPCPGTAPVNVNLF